MTRHHKIEDYETALRGEPSRPWLPLWLPFLLIGMVFGALALAAFRVALSLLGGLA